MAALALLVTAVLLWAPGALLGRALGLQRRWALVTAPALTWGAVTAAGVAVPRLGLAWGPWTALAALGAGLVAALLLARLRRRSRGDDGAPQAPPPGAAPCPPPSGLRSWLAAGTGCAAATALVVAVAWRAGHPLGGTAQTWDAVYHANLTTFMATTGDSDPVSAPSALASAGWRTVDTYYPAALHALAALVVRLTGAGAATALDALLALVSAAVVPVAAAALAATAAPARRGTAAAVTAAVAAVPVAYPYDQWWRGVWSYGVAVAVALLVAVLAVRALQGRLVPGRPVAAATAALLGLLGVAGLQPAGVVLAGVLVLGWALGRLVSAVRRPAGRPPRPRLLVGVAAALAGTALLPPLVLGLARWSSALGSLAAYDYTSRSGSPASVLGAVRSVLGTVRQVLPAYGYGVPHQSGQWLLAAVVVGAALVVALHGPVRWLAAVWLLVVLAAASTIAPVGGVLTPAGAAALRSLTLFFYGAPFRLVAVAALLGAVVVGVAAGRLAALLDRHPGSGPRHRLLRPTAAVGAVALLAVLAAGTLERAPVRMAAGYTPRVTGPDQLAVMAQLAQQVREHPLPAGATVADDPADGSAWLYALHDLPVLFRHYSPGAVTPPAALLLERLDDVDTDAGVQQALRDLRVCYVYASDTPVQDLQPLAPGFADLEGAELLQPVARQGGAAAYRVLVPGTPCAG
ncbi:DUF6541 family protein [Quadrisphaera sp. INWT6]|uniref:DUF6541 family protein n=1 Tax=Quadrisphaera sp. INWT6 TaxID=2596917 RepID=UPI00189270BB|nr:DUF6541 family protein [Quadrisphaera sp. INWT6]